MSSFTKHREKFQLNKSNANPNKPPGYDDCLSVIDMRPHKRKDKSRAPGRVFPKTPSLPIQPERRDDKNPNMTFQIPAGVAPQVNPAYANSFTTPPVQFHPPMYQAPPRSPTARDLEVQRCAKIIYEAAAAVWGVSDEGTTTSSDEEEEETAPTSLTSGHVSPSEQSPQPVGSPNIAQLSVQAHLGNQPSAPERSPQRSGYKRSPTEELPEQAEPVVKRPRSRDGDAANPVEVPDRSGHISPQKIPSSPHVPIYLPNSGTLSVKPPRQGFVIKFDSRKGVVKSPTPPSIPPASSAPGPPPRHGTVIRFPDQLATRLNSNYALAEPVEGVPHYLPVPPPVLASHPPSFRPSNYQAAPPQPQIICPPVMGGFRPINGNGVVYLPANQIPQQYSFAPASDPRAQLSSQPPLPPPKNGTVVSLHEPAPTYEHPPPLAPPKNGNVLRLYGPAPVSEHPPRERPPKNGTIIKFQRPYQGTARKKV